MQKKNNQIHIALAVTEQSLWRPSYAFSSFEKTFSLYKRVSRGIKYGLVINLTRGKIRTQSEQKDGLGFFLIFLREAADFISYVLNGCKSIFFL